MQVLCQWADGKRGLALGIPNKQGSIPRKTGSSTRPGSSLPRRSRVRPDLRGARPGTSCELPNQPARQRHHALIAHQPKVCHTSQVNYQWHDKEFGCWLYERIRDYKWKLDEWLEWNDLSLTPKWMHRGGPWSVVILYLFEILFVRVMTTDGAGTDRHVDLSGFFCCFAF
jgi:hypothetical protein